MSGNDIQFDARSFRRSMGRFASGVTVVATQRDGEVHGMTANAFVSVSLDPPLVLVSIGERARMHGMLRCGVAVGISILALEQEHESDRFAGRGSCAGAPSWEWLGGAPVLSGALGQVAGTVHAVHAAGDHTLFVVRVAALAERDARPLLFFGGRYAQLHADNTAALATA